MIIRTLEDDGDSEEEEDNRVQECDCQRKFVDKNGRHNRIDVGTQIDNRKKQPSTGCEDVLILHAGVEEKESTGDSQ